MPKSTDLYTNSSTNQADINKETNSIDDSTSELSLDNTITNDTTLNDESMNRYDDPLDTLDGDNKIQEQYYEFIIPKSDATIPKSISQVMKNKNKDEFLQAAETEYQLLKLIK